MPEYHITKIYITDEIVKDFHAELLNTHVAQKLLLDNRNIWNSNKKHLRACGDCAEGKCYDCGVCNYVTRIMTKNKIDMRKTLEDKLKAVLPNKELPA
jgi:hypothetical protein